MKHLYTQLKSNMKVHSELSTEKTYTADNLSLHRSFINRKSLLSFNCIFADGVEEIFLLLLPGAQTLFMLVEPATHSSGFLGSQVQGLVLLALEHVKMMISTAQKIKCEEGKMFIWSQKTK